MVRNAVRKWLKNKHTKDVDVAEITEVLKVTEVAKFTEVTETVEVTGDLENCKHALEHTWTFWFQEKNNKKDWKDNLVEVTSFDTVEDYWCLYHHTKMPSELQLGEDYSFFKKGILPMWEDKENKRGGRWLLLIDKGQSAFMDRTWLDTVLLVIGQNFEDNDSITGVVVNIRPYSKIAIWTKDCSDMNVNMRIGKKLKATLGFRRKIEYMAHNTTKILYSI